MTPNFRLPVSPLRIAVGLCCLLLMGVALAQQKSGEPTAPSSSSPRSQQKPDRTEEQRKQLSQGQNQPGINQEFGQPLAAQSEKAAGGHAGAAEGKEAEGSREKTVEQLRLSPSVRWMANHLHLSPAAGYWVGYIFDFALLALLIAWALKKNLPSMFRTRTQSIQRGLEEARKASEEANRRLAAIEARLAKLDVDVGAMRAAAEQEAAAEERRILAAAEEDKRRIVEAAESEIAAAAKLARGELKTYAADLAVTLAERRIRVDAATDQALVRGFVEQLADARTPGSDGAGKDGK